MLPKRYPFPKPFPESVRRLKKSMIVKIVTVRQLSFFYEDFFAED